MTNIVWRWIEESRQSDHYCYALVQFLPDHGILTDTAFPCVDHLRGRIMTSAKEGEIEKAPRHLQGIMTRLSAAITAVRQAAEWGVGAVEKVYQRLAKPHLQPKCAST